MKPKGVRYNQGAERSPLKFIATLKHPNSFQKLTVILTFRHQYTSYVFFRDCLDNSCNLQNCQLISKRDTHHFIVSAIISVNNIANSLSIFMSVEALKT